MKGADAGTGDLAFGEDAQENHEFFVAGLLGVGGAAQFWDPDGGVVVVEERAMTVNWLP